MPTTKQIYFPVTTSANLLRAFVSVIPVIWKGAPIRIISIDTSLLNSHYKNDNVSQNFLTMPDFQAFEKFISENAFIEIRSIRTHHHQQTFSGIQLEQKPGEFYGTLNFFEENSQPKDRDPVFLHTIVECLANTLSFSAYTQIAIEKIDSKGTEVIKAHQAQVKSLEAILEKQVALVANGISKWDEKIRSISEGLQSTYQKKLDELEIVYKDKHNAIKIEEEALNKRVKEIDDREYLHARRSQFEDMKKSIIDGTEVKLSKETVDKRAPVFKSFLAIFIAASFSAIAFLYTAFSSENFNYLYGFSISMITLICFLFYFLKWQDYYFTTHSEVEISNQVYKNDILRANWLAEMVYESKLKEDTSMPNELLASFSRNLFASRNSKTKVPVHPYEEVFSVIKNIKGVTVDNSGIKIENK
ncbi:MAG: hypothetical protein ACD_39C01668G0002 [uncultured bacterium]|nr:MAG: hypothetical protein ACD_39C01668G0002 [uncultured bacterium]